MARDVGQIQRLFHSGIPATDYSHWLIAVEKSVTCRASRHTFAHEGSFTRQAKILGACACGDDHRVGGVVACPASQHEWPLRKVDLFDIVIFNARSETLSMLAHPLHQFRPHHACIIAGPIVDFGRGHQLPAYFDSRNHHRRQIGARGVNGSSIAGRSRANDDNRCVAIFGHRRSF